MRTSSDNRTTYLTAEKMVSLLVALNVIQLVYLLVVLKVIQLVYLSVVLKVVSWVVWLVAQLVE